MTALSAIVERIAKLEAQVAELLWRMEHAGHGAIPTAHLEARQQQQKDERR